MKSSRSLLSTLVPLRAFSLLSVVAIVAFVIATPGSSAKPALPVPTGSADSAVLTAGAQSPAVLKNEAHIMVELTDAPAAVTWATAYKQAQAQLDAQRNYALQHPTLKSSVTFLKTAPTQATISTTAMTQVKSVAQTIAQKQQSILPSLTGGNIGGKVLYRVQMAYNGIAMTVSPDKIASIAAMPGVKAVHPLNPKYLLNTFSDIDFLNTRPAWTTGPFGTHGENIKVADIDSGLDYIHRDFGGSGSAADYMNITDATPVPNADFPTPKVPNGIDLAGDDYNPRDPMHTVPMPDNNPLDCNGHGTGTASLIAGYGVTNAGFTYSGSYDASNPDMTTLSIPPGFAPNAKIIPVRVFGCPGGLGASVSSASEVITQGIDWAMTQGTGNPANRVDVINMSLGASGVPPDDPDAVAAANAASIGIIVCSASGNSGDSFYITSAPADAPNTLSVAASFNNQNGFVYQGLVNGNQPAALAGLSFKATKSSGSPPTPGGMLTGDVVYGIPHDGGPAMTPADSSPLTNAAQCNGKIVLLDRGGGVTFEQKVKRATASGAIGVIIANNNNNPRNDFPPINVGLFYSATIPEFGISFNDGNTLKAAAAFDAGDGHSTSSPAANVTLVDSVGVVTVAPNGSGTPAGGGSPDTMASYSARGPRPLDSATKPDITSPAEITMVALSGADPAKSGATGTGTGFENFNGTSSSTPHVAGMMALLRQLHPTWSVQELLALACNTATHDLFTTVGGAGGVPVGIGRVGAGRNDVGLAAAATVVAYNSSDPGLLGVSFGSVEVPEGGTTTLTKTIKVSNKGATNITYNTSVTNNPSVAGLGTVFSVSPSNFTINAGTSTTLTVTMTATGSNIIHQRDPSVSSTQLGVQREWLTEAGGYAVLTPTDSSPVLRVELYANPKPASSMHATSSNFVPTSANTGSFSISLAGTGVTNLGSTFGTTASRNVQSLVKAFELQYVNPAVGQPNAPTNRNVIKYVGVTSDYITGGNDAIMFAVEKFGNAATPDFNSSDTEIFIDTNPADIGVTFNANYGMFLGNLGNDSSINQAGLENVYFSNLVDENTSVVTAQEFTNGLTDLFIDTNIFNNSGVVMGTFASSMGMGQFASPAGPTKFQYIVVTFDENGNEVDESPILVYDVANPGLDVNDTSLVPGVARVGRNVGAGPFEPFWYTDLQTNSVPVNWNGANFRANGSIGVWLFHTHNANGNRSDVVRFLPPTISSFSPTSAHVGDFVTITGTNFNAGTTVTFFHNVNATNVILINSNTLSVQVPAGATSGPIRVSNAAGSSAKAGFTVLP